MKKRGRYYLAGTYTKKCKWCGKKMSFVYHCIMKKKIFCSRRCGNEYKRNNPVKNQYGVSEPWTKEQDKLLVEKAPNCFNLKSLVGELHKNYDQIKSRFRVLGLSKTPQVKRECLAAGGRKNKGRKRPDFVRNVFHFGKGKLNNFYGKNHSAETKQLLSEVAKKAGVFHRLAKDPEFQRKRMLGLHARPNKPEIIVRELLDRLFPGEYKYTGNGEFVVDGLSPDFTNVNGQKKLIEVFGETYHDPKQSKWKIPLRLTEKGRRQVFAKYGYRLLVIWSKEIFHGGKDGRRKLKHKIKEFHESLCD